MKIALTGHRPDRLNGKEDEVKKWITDILGEYECEVAYSGMAMGADQIFAQAALDNNIPLICCYPFKKSKFHPVEQAIIDKAQDTRFISEKYSKKAYWIRDKYMVDNCDLLLAVFDGNKSGGTYITVDYAERIGKPVIYFPFNNNANRTFDKWDIVQHFKRDTNNYEDMTYLYQIVDFAIHTETNEHLVIYRALYGERNVFARPYDMFMAEVNREKYPNARQKYVFEKWKQ